MREIADRLDVARDRLQGVPRERELVDVAVAAAILDVPKTWVLEQARRGQIPHIRLGRYVRFEPDELRAWWRSQRRGPAR